MTPLQRAWRAVGGLSTPSKMPGYAWGISAKRCITGSKLRKIEGTVCSKCYALKGRYVFDNVVKAHERRLRAFNRDSDKWVMNMAWLINHLKGTGAGWFRWFDSGDLQSVDMMWAICSVCWHTPNTKHWLSTREYSIVTAWMSEFGPLPDNLCVRMAVHKIDGAPNRCYPLTAGLTQCVTETGQRSGDATWCPAHCQGNKCGTCRACWDRDEQLVSYILH